MTDTKTQALQQAQEAAKERVAYWRALAQRLMPPGGVAYTGAEMTAMKAARELELLADQIDGK